MRFRRGIAAGIVAIAGFVAPAAAAEIPYWPPLAGGAAAILARDDAPGLTDPLPHHSTVLGEAVIAGAAIGVWFLLDDAIEPGSGDGTAMDDMGQFIGSPYTLGAGSGVLLMGGMAVHRRSTVGTATRLFASIAATTATVALLKMSTDRERPDGANRNSFPSGHSGASFAAATVLDRRYGGAVGWAAHGLAAFVAASRVVGNHHFFSDVMAGAVIGRFFGRIFTMGHHSSE
jgi:membrane-associated phospholipid phosphatase